MKEGGKELIEDVQEWYTWDFGEGREPAKYLYLEDFGDGNAEDLSYEELEGQE